MLKDYSANNLGNTSDAAMTEWLPTVEKLREKFGSAKNVIPGHRKPGGMELIKHTIELLHKSESNKTN